MQSAQGESNASCDCHSAVQGALPWLECAPQMRRPLHTLPILTKHMTSTSPGPTSPAHWPDRTGSTHPGTAHRLPTDKPH